MTPPPGRVRKMMQDIVKANRFFHWAGDIWVSFCPVGTPNCCRQACAITPKCQYFREYGPITMPYAEVIRCDLWGEGHCLWPGGTSSAAASASSSSWSSSSMSLLSTTTARRGLGGHLQRTGAVQANWTSSTPLPMPGILRCGNQDFGFIHGHLVLTFKEVEEVVHRLHGRLPTLTEAQNWVPQSGRWIGEWVHNVWTLVTQGSGGYDGYNLAGLRGDWAPLGSEDYVTYAHANAPGVKNSDIEKKSQVGVYCAKFPQAQFPCGPDDGTMLIVDAQTATTGPQQAVRFASNTGGRLPTLTETRRYPPDLWGPGDLVSSRPDGASSWNFVEVDVAASTCPSACKAPACKAGSSTDGGVPLGANGACVQWCSAGGYCGTGTTYRHGGTDCVGCATPQCPGDCYMCSSGYGNGQGGVTLSCDETMSGNGHNYMGCATKTKTGKTCQRWDAQYPHTHNWWASDVGQASWPTNFCRNPGGGHHGLWCYTTDWGTRWDDCDPLPSKQIAHVCEHFCGVDGTCGTGTHYEDGTDCQGCVVSASSSSALAELGAESFVENEAEGQDSTVVGGEEEDHLHQTDEDEVAALAEDGSVVREDNEAANRAEALAQMLEFGGGTSTSSRSLAPRRTPRKTSGRPTPARGRSFGGSSLVEEEDHERRVTAWPPRIRFSLKGQSGKERVIVSFGEEQSGGSTSTSIAHFKPQIEVKHATATDWGEVSCPTGYQVIGGGCNASSNGRTETGDKKLCPNLCQKIFSKRFAYVPFLVVVLYRGRAAASAAAGSVDGSTVSCLSFCIYVLL